MKICIRICNCTSYIWSPKLLAFCLGNGVKYNINIYIFFITFICIICSFKTHIRASNKYSHSYPRNSFNYPRNKSCSSEIQSNPISDFSLLPPQYNCGSRTNHNSTYFVNNGYPSSFNSIGQCSTTIEKVLNTETVSPNHKVIVVVIRLI